MKIPTILSIFIGLAFTLASLEPVHANVFNCPAGDVDCLIDAINTANTNGEDDTINLEAGTYTLTTVDNETDGSNGLPSISTAITITGKGNDSTLIERDNSAPEFRIFHVSNTGDFVLDKLSVLNGYQSEKGGGIFNTGALNVNRCKFLNNDAGFFGGAIYNSNATADISNSIFSNNSANPPDIYLNSGGGGICYEKSSGTISNSIFISNVGRNGAAILNISSSLIITDCTFSENRTSDDGGAIRNMNSNVTIRNNTFNNNEGAGGGAIANDGSSVYITNSTFSNNTSRCSGGAIYDRENINVFITNCTFSLNVSHGSCGPGGGEGGGILFGGSEKLQNTILANNNGLEGDDCYGVAESLGNNIIGDISDCGITLLPTDLIGDPGIDDFTEDVTPGKGHFPLLESSPAIDKGDDAACLPTDQLGNLRVDGDGDGNITCDIGAIESQLQLRELNDYVTFDPDPSSYSFTSDINRILFQDDFNDGNNFGWTTTMGEWDATSGYNEATGLYNGRWAYTYAGNASWDNYTLDVDITFGTGNTEFIVAVRVDPSSSPDLVGGRQYYLSVDGDNNVIRLRYTEEPSGFFDLQTIPYNLLDKETYHIRISIISNNLIASIDGNPIFDYTFSGATPIYSNGAIGIGYQSDDGPDGAYFDNVIVKAPGCPPSFAGKFSFDATLTNISEKTLSNLHVEVDELTNNNLLLTDIGLIGEGERFEVPKIDDYADGYLSADEYVDVPFMVCLKIKKPFRFFVNVAGVAAD